VEVFVPLFADHHGVVGPALRPHALTSEGSFVVPPLSVTSGWTL
jgi:hypothetical protein